MIIIHAIWTNSALHLLGERCAGAKDDGQPSSFDLEPSTLRQCLGDVCDSLLVSGATDSELTLHLPHDDGRPLPSWRQQPPSAEPGVESAERTISLQPCRVSTLAFAVADAVDLLSAEDQLREVGDVEPLRNGNDNGNGDLCGGASLRYWRRVAWFVLELLARQRFVPSVHRTDQSQYMGFWRPVLDDEPTAHNLRILIASMPPVCRALGVPGSSLTAQPVQAASLVESFLWKAVDALVRRCLEGDELAHAISDPTREESSPSMRWLRALVGADPILAGPTHECAGVYESVTGWIAKLESPIRGGLFRTCFRLHPPQGADGPASALMSDPWRLTLHVEGSGDSSLVLEVSQLTERTSDQPRILPQPIDQAREQFRADLIRAARYFPPLVRDADAPIPSEIQLTLNEAYAFLRDAAPILESEGYGVQTPRWWQPDRPRLGMRLDIHPLEPDESVERSPMSFDALVAYDWRVSIGDEDVSLEELTEWAASNQSLVNFRGQWMEVQPPDMQKAVDFLKDKRSGRMTLFEALRQCYVADDLDSGIPVVGLRGEGWIDDLLCGADPNRRMDAIAPPEGFHGTLRPYQLSGISWLNFLSEVGLGACLADDMGLGKTIQLIGLWLHERQAGKTPGPTLLIVPTSLVGNWRREIARFGPSLKVMVHHGVERLSGPAFVEEVARLDVVISTYALTYRDFDHLSAVDWHRIALDEAQNIKNPSAKQSLAVRSMRSVQRVALTGTPVENRLSDRWSIMDFLNPGYLGSAADFRRRFAVPIERYRDAPRSQRLRQLIRPFVLRRLKSDPTIQVDLPEKMEMKVLCNLTGEQASLYKEVLANMIEQIDSADGIRRRGLILATLVTLKQICNHPAHFLGDGRIPPHRSGKSDRLTEMLEEVVAEGDGALVFTQYRKMGMLLKKILGGKLGVEILFLHGGCSLRQRDAMVERFQKAEGDVPVFLLSLRAGGFGLNLTAANHVFHFDRWWNPAVEDQATDRVHRIHQHKRVHVYKFMCIGTLEERIDTLLEGKRKLADSIVGSGEDWLTELSTDQLRDLFALSREAVEENGP